MAKVKNLWFRGIKGKLDGAVAYNLNGQQVVRGEAANVANPRTPAQMVRRVKLAHIVNFWRAMRPWGFKHAFESKARTLSDYNAFTQANLSGSMVALTKEQAGAGACVVAPYLVTKGTLPSIEVIADFDKDEFFTNLYVGSDAPAIDAMTVGMLSERLVANNNGIQVGDQLSLVHLIQNTASQAGVPTLTVRYYEMILSLSDTRLVKEVFGTEDITIHEQNEVKTLGVAINDAYDGATFILSRTTSGKTQVSSQRIVQFSEEIYSQYTSAAAVAEATASYGIGQEYFLDTTGSDKGSNGNVDTALSIVGVRRANGSSLITSGSQLPTNNLGSSWSIVWNKNAPVPTTSDTMITVTYSDGTVTEIENEESIVRSGKEWNVAVSLESSMYVKTIKCIASDGSVYVANYDTSSVGGQGDPGDVTD